MATIPNNPTTEQLDAVNEMLAAVGQAPVNQLEATNPDVALAFDTLTRTSREVQAEGWSYNKEYKVTRTRVNVVSGNATATRVPIPDNIVFMDLCSSHKNASYDSVIRTDNGNRYLYDRENHTFNFDFDPEVDIIYEFDYLELPKPIQDYVLARASAVFASRLVGDPQLYQILKQAEAERRVAALEFECNQGDYTFFGHPEGGNYYNSYQPYHALSRS